MSTDDEDGRRRMERLKELKKQEGMIAKVFEGVGGLLRDMAERRGRSKVLYRKWKWNGKHFVPYVSNALCFPAPRDNGAY